jgi:hypothetical protein
MAQEQFKVNIAQHRGGYTIDNEDGTKEFAFVTNRQHAHLFADTGNRMVKLEAAARVLGGCDARHRGICQQSHQRGLSEHVVQPDRQVQNSAGRPGPGDYEGAEQPAPQLRRFL